jgi:hypothetical protein
MHTDVVQVDRNSKNRRIFGCEWAGGSSLRTDGAAVAMTASSNAALPLRGT